MIMENDLFGGGRGPLDTSNQFAVGVKTDGLVAVNRPVMGVMTRAEALNLAAWIVALSDPTGKEFWNIVARIQKGN